MDGAVDRLRAVAPRARGARPTAASRHRRAVVLAAADPANAYGAALPWPEPPDGRRPQAGRKAGSLVGPGRRRADALHGARRQDPAGLARRPGRPGPPTTRRLHAAAEALGRSRPRGRPRHGHGGAGQRRLGPDLAPRRPPGRRRASRHPARPAPARGPDRATGRRPHRHAPRTAPPVAHHGAMPEGDTVWQAARRLHDALAGQVADPLRPAGAPVRHRRPHRPHRPRRHPARQAPPHPHRGRPHPPLPSADGRRLAGVRHRPSAGAAARPTRSGRSSAPPDHTAVGYRLPVLELLRTADEDRAVGHLGPDLLGPDWDPDEALRHLLADPARPLGEALLDQRNLAGIGNVYKCELCFLLGVTPWLPVGAAARRPRRAAARPSPRSSWRPTATARPASPPARRRGQRPVRLRPRATAPACAAAPRSARPTRATAPANAPPTGARPASRARTGTELPPTRPVRSLTPPQLTARQNARTVPHARHGVRPHRPHRIRHRRRQRHRPRRPPSCSPRRAPPCTARTATSRACTRRRPSSRPGRHRPHPPRSTSPTAPSSGRPSAAVRARSTSWRPSPGSCTAARPGDPRRGPRPRPGRQLQGRAVRLPGGGPPHDRARAPAAPSSPWPPAPSTPASPACSATARPRRPSSS